LLSMIDDGDGWLQEIARENNLPFTRKSQPDAQESRRDQRTQLKDRYQSHVRKLKARIQEAEEAGKESQIKALNKQLAQLRQQARKQGVDEESSDDSPEQFKPAASEAVAQPPVIDMAKIIDEAYLRTLSRFPTADEVQTASTFIRESQDPVDGIRSVLWALVNTREFLVNH